MTNEELRDKLTRTYGWVNKLAKWRKNQEVNSVYGLRWLQRIHKLQLSLINQFKSDVEEERCKQCTFSFNKKGGYYHDVEDYYKD